MATERERILEAAIVEQQHTFARVSNIYDQLRLKALAVLAGEVAMITFLFSGDGVALPEETYGKLFYYTGVVALLFAFGLLMWTISPLLWKMPYDTYSSKDLISKYKTKLAFLEYLNDDYMEAINHCSSNVSRRSKRFNWTIYTLCVGVTILLAIKYGGRHNENDYGYRTGCIVIQGSHQDFSTCNEQETIQKTD